MRPALSLIFMLISLCSFGQEDTVTLNFLNDVLNRKTDSSHLFYADKVHVGMYDYMMKKPLLKNRIKDINGSGKANLRLTAAEITQFKQSLTASKSHQWQEHLFMRSKRIHIDSLHSFLLSNPENDLYLFSYPAFIRNNTIALFYVVHLCCGGIYGPVDLSFYHRENGKWKRWIRIDGGAF